MSLVLTRRYVLVLMSIVVQTGSATRADDDRRPEALVAKVDALFETSNRPDVPGCAVGIIQDGGLKGRFGKGARHQPRRPLRDLKRLSEALATNHYSFFIVSIN